MRNQVWQGFVAVWLLVVLVAGCRNETWGEQFFPKNEVLLRSKLTFDSTPLSISPPTPLVVKGEVSICLVLANLNTYDQRSNGIFLKAMGGAAPVAALHSSTGQVFRLASSHETWYADGTLSSDGEISNCLASDDGPPEGAEIDLIKLSADRPLHVLGVYWSDSPK